MAYAGTRVARVEDTRLLTGHGTRHQISTRWCGQLCQCVHFGPAVQAGACDALHVVTKGISTGKVLVDAPLGHAC